MDKVRTCYATEEQAEERARKRLTHIEGEGVSGFDTLCGHCDRTTWRWKAGGKVNCPTCLRIWNYVKNQELP